MPLVSAASSREIAGGRPSSCRSDHVQRDPHAGLARDEDDPPSVARQHAWKICAGAPVARQDDNLKKTAPVVVGDRGAHAFRESLITNDGETARRIATAGVGLARVADFHARSDLAEYA